MTSAPPPAPNSSLLLIPDSNSPGVDFSNRPLLNPLIWRRFIGICLVTFWSPRRYLNGDKQMSAGLL